MSLSRFREGRSYRTYVTRQYFLLFLKNTLSSCAALLPASKTVTLSSASLIVTWHWFVFLLSWYQIADYNYPPRNALNFKATQYKVNPCTETHYTKQNKRSKQGLTIGNTVYGKRIFSFPSQGSNSVLWNSGTTHPPLKPTKTFVTASTLFLQSWE